MPNIPEAVEFSPEEEAILQTPNGQALLRGDIIAMASSNVEEIWYDIHTNTLFVVFKPKSKSGARTYAYYHVPLRVADAFIKSSSPGRFVWNELRDRYPYNEVSRSQGIGTKKPNVVRAIPSGFQVKGQIPAGFQAKQS